MGLFIASSDGSDEHRLLDSNDSDYDPAWAPDGASVVFTSDRAGSADLFRVGPDGSGLERLTTDPAYDDQAAFSPDGKQLVFVSTRRRCGSAVDDGSGDAKGEGPDFRKGARLSAFVVSQRQVDRVLV